MLELQTSYESIRRESKNQSIQEKNNLQLEKVVKWQYKIKQSNHHYQPKANPWSLYSLKNKPGSFTHLQLPEFLTTHIMIHFQFSYSNNSNQFLFFKTHLQQEQIQTNQLQWSLHS